MRKWVENGLKEGKLKAVVATSSLDLGVDFSPVERVLQIGSAKGVARLLQRAGRSGHAPGQVSRVTCVPSHALEFVEAAAARRAAMAGRIESRQPVDRPLDLLTQHLVTIAAGEGFDAEALKAEVRSTRAYRDLSDAEWQWALDFVTRGGDALKAYSDYHKVVRDEDGTWRVKDAAIAKRHRMSIGTIVSEAAVDIRYLSGKRLGNVEESFIARLAKGDTFVFAGHLLEFIRVENMTAYVRPGKPGSAVIPRWDGGRCPLSSEVAEGIRELLELHVERRENEPEMKAVSRLLKLQNAWSRVPRAQRDPRRADADARGPPHLLLSVRGALRAPGPLGAARLSHRTTQGGDVLARVHRLRLRAARPRALRAPAAAQGRAASRPRTSSRTCSRASTPRSSRSASSARSRAWRASCSRAIPGSRRRIARCRRRAASSTRCSRAGTRRIPLLGQAEREVLERQLEFSRLADGLRRMGSTPVLLRQTHKPSPFAFPIMVSRFREKLTSEKLADRVRRMQLEYDKATLPSDVVPEPSGTHSSGTQQDLFQ